MKLPYIRAGVLEQFASTSLSLGTDPDSLLEQAAVAPEVLSVPGVFLPYIDYMNLLDCAAKTTQTPHFGLLMSRVTSTETLGTLGIIMTQAETVGAAFQALSRFYRIHDTYGRVRLYRYPESAMISYALPRNDQAGTRQVHDVAAGVAINIMRQFCGADFRAETLNLPYPEPADTDSYRDLPVEQIHFNAGAMELFFPAGLLRKPLSGRGHELSVMLDGYLARHEGVRHSSVHLVEDRIRQLLPTGECTLERVAQTLATSPRTLQTRLASRGTGFRQLTEQVRREIATFHLRRGDMQLGQLASVLGYSELSAFSRSFRQWYGVSPRSWVKRGEWLAQQGDHS